MGGCFNKIEVNSSIDEVWRTLSDFHDMSWAPNVITSVGKVGDKAGNEVGAKRILNDAFHETLAEVDAANYSISYTIDDGPGPVAKGAVANYVGKIKLSATDDGTLVEWSSTFESPNDSEVSDFCNPIYVGLLGDLKMTLER